jgi:hypothetical protein
MDNNNMADQAAALRAKAKLARDEHFKLQTQAGARYYLKN